MTSKFDGYNYILRLNKDELLVESLEKFVAEKKLGGAWLNGLGGAQWAEVGFYHMEDKTYTWEKLEMPLEIISLQGNIAWNDNKPYLHIHGSFADDKMKSYGGHVKELEVAGTCEIFLHVLSNVELKRDLDDDTGLLLLDV